MEEKTQKTRYMDNVEVNSRFGKYLTNVVTKRVIVLFLVMVLLIPLNEDNISFKKNDRDDILVLLDSTTASLAMCYDPTYRKCFD